MFSLTLCPCSYPKIAKSRRIQKDLTTPSTSAPQLTKLQNPGDIYKKHNYDLEDAESTMNQLLIHQQQYMKLIFLFS